MSGKSPSRDRTRLSAVEKLVRDAPWLSSPAYTEGQIMFCIRSNVGYDGDKDATPPALGNPLSFHPNDFMQVVKILDEDWWMARLFGDGPECGIIPSPKHFLAKHTEIQEDSKPKQKQSTVKRLSSLLSSNVVDDPELDVEAQQAAAERRKTQQAQIGKTLLNFSARGERDKVHPAMEMPYPMRAIYDIAPRIRPLVFVGPSKLGCPVTDKLQRALINYLQLTFPDMCAVAPVHTWPIGGKKFRRGGFRPQLAQVGHSVGDAATNTGGYMTDASQLFDREDLTFAKKNASHQKLSIFQVDPEELQVVRNSSLMPVVVMVKIGDLEVLAKLIKEYGEGGQTIAVQLRAAEILASMRQEDFDLVLSQSALDRCCYELTAFVDMFLGETIFEPVLDPTNVMGGATLRKSSSQGEADGYLNIASRKDEADDWANVQNALKTKGARDDFDGLDGFAFEL